MKETIECYIINLITDSRIEFELTPEEVSDSVSAQYDETVPRGRSNPILGYNSSGPRTVSYTIPLHDDYCKEGILATVNKLQALAYPIYHTGSIQAPTALIRLGKMVNTTGVCTEVGVTWKKPYRDGVYLNADVSLTFTETLSTPKGAVDIESGEFVTN